MESPHSTETAVLNFVSGTYVLSTLALDPNVVIAGVVGFSIIVLNLFRTLESWTRRKRIERGLDLPTDMQDPQ